MYKRTLGLYGLRYASMYYNIQLADSSGVYQPARMDRLVGILLFEYNNNDLAHYCVYSRETG